MEHHPRSNQLINLGKQSGQNMTVLLYAYP